MNTRDHASAIVGAFALTMGGFCAYASQSEIAETPNQRDVKPKWSLDDLVVDPLGSPAQLAGLLKGPQGGISLLGGDIDVGDIAVLEDDGTLINGNTTNTIAILNRFYQSHGDEYDEIHIHVASTFPGDIDPEAGFAFFQLFAGFVGGINRTQGNPNQSFGISRLTGLTNMNDLPEYPDDPNEDFFGGGIASYVEIMGQEFEHAWGAFVQADPSTGTDIIGRGEAHWSFFLNHAGVNNASPMEGNHWMQNGGGSFITIDSFSGLAELDSYLMGLRAPDNMQPFWVIDFPPGGDPFNDSAFPQIGVTVEGGTRIDLTVQDIIDNYGPRGPDTSTSMKTFKTAFILVVPQGEAATQADLDKMNSFRLAWADYFHNTTETLGTIDSTLALAQGVDPSEFSQFDDFENGIDFARYEYVQGATTSSLGLGEPSGIKSMRLNGNWGGGDEIRSIPIDLSLEKSGSVTLEYAFERTGGGNSPETGENLNVEYFANDGLWKTLRVFLGNGPDQIEYATFSETIPDDGLHDQFRFRFLRDQGTIGDVDDIFIDDLGLSISVATPGDLNGDGVVDTSDLLILFANWGPCDNCDDCSADLNGDCVVNTSDLLLLFSNWG